MADAGVNADNREALFSQAAQGRAVPLNTVEMPLALDELKTKAGLFESAEHAIYFGLNINDSNLLYISKLPLK